MHLDLSDLSRQLSDATSAMQVSVIAEEMKRSQRVVGEINRQMAEKDATFVAGAEASIAQKELLEQQLEVIKKQNELLCDNYMKLKELYDAQVQANKEAKDDLKKSRRFNAWMMVISIIAMLAAIASPVVTLWVS
jgi:hypothetical protein